MAPRVTMVCAISLVECGGDTYVAPVYEGMRGFERARGR